MLPVAILAGGLATRMRPLTEKVPKILLEVASEPFIFHQMRQLQKYGVTRIVLCIGHLGEKVREILTARPAPGLDIQFSEDGEKLLGTGGALKKALPLLGEQFMVMYGDSFLDVDYSAVSRAFLSSGLPALMTVYENNLPGHVNNVLFRDGQITIYDKHSPTLNMRHIDYGLGCLSSCVFEDMPDEFDLAYLYAFLSRQGQLAGYEVASRFYEIGSFEGLRELDALLRNRT